MVVLNFLKRSLTVVAIIDFVRDWPTWFTSFPGVKQVIPKGSGSLGKPRVLAWLFLC